MTRVVGAEGAYGSSEAGERGRERCQERGREGWAVGGRGKRRGEERSDGFSSFQLVILKGQLTRLLTKLSMVDDVLCLTHI